MWGQAWEIRGVLNISAICVYIYLKNMYIF